MFHTRGSFAVPTSRAHEPETPRQHERDADRANLGGMVDALHSSISLLAIVVPQIDAALAEAATPSTEGIRTALCIGLTTVFTVAGILLTDRAPQETS